MFTDNKQVLILGQSKIKCVISSREDGIEMFTKQFEANLILKDEQYRFPIVAIVISLRQH